MLILGLGFLCAVVSILLLFVPGTRANVIGYVVGSVVPLLLIGFFRRTDLRRRRSARYVVSGLVGPGVTVLVILTLALAGLHVWPIATDIAS